MKKENPRDDAAAALKQARNAARRNDLKEAERWSKAAQALVETAERIAKLPPSRSDAEEAEAIRTEIRSRIQRLIAASEANAPDGALETIVTAPFLIDGRRVGP